MIYLERLPDMFTIHSYLYHFLHILNIIDSTYSIALFVFIVGTFVQLVHHNKKTDAPTRRKIGLFIIHLLPLFFIKDKRININILVISLFIYFLYMGSLQKIYNVYKNVYSYLRSSKNCDF